MVEYLTMRASSLPALFDCVRRYSARAHRKDIEKMGIVLNPGRQSAAAEIGNALHRLVANLLRAKLAFGEVSARDVDEALDAVYPSFLEAANKQEMLFNKTTRNFDDARKQLRAMGEKMLGVIDLVNPQHIETAYTWDVSPLGKQAIPVKLTGHVDVIDSRGEIHDHKTGAQFPSSHAQLGAYSILAKFHDIDISNARINYVKTPPLSKLADMELKSMRLDLHECEQSAWVAIREYQRYYERWLESGRDPWSFPANPMSMMCTENYCSAYGTPYCRVGAI